jgi:hypothetical protein
MSTASSAQHCDHESRSPADAACVNAASTNADAFPTARKTIPFLWQRFDVRVQAAAPTTRGFDLYVTCLKCRPARSCDRWSGNGGTRRRLDSDMESSLYRSRPPLLPHRFAIGDDDNLHVLGEVNHSLHRIAE